MTDGTITGLRRLWWLIRGSPRSFPMICSFGRWQDRVRRITASENRLNWTDGVSKNTSSEINLRIF